MPTYEFRCPKGHDFEKFFKTMSTAPSELTCPECGALASRQLSGGAGFAFKGSGFYLTDYGKNAHRGTADKKPDKTAETKSDKTTDTKTESAKPKAESSKPKTESPKPKAPSPKPKSE